MPRLRTTIGSLLVNEALPEDLRDYDRTLTKAKLTDLLSNLAQKHPEKYRDISFRLNQIGRQAAYSTGGHSFGLKHIRQASAAQKIRSELQKELAAIDNDDSLSDEERERKTVLAVGRRSKSFADEIFNESVAEDNPLALQIVSGARGNKTNLASLRGGDLLYTDHRDRVMPIPVLRSYSQGLTPAEYWAGAYGARKGVVDTKLAIADAGYLGKQLSQMSHRAVVVDLDGDGEPDTLRGYPVSTDDPDNEGALLAAPAGDYPRNTVITPKILADLRRKNVARLLVRSPIAGSAPDGGVYARDVGVREFGRLPTPGESVGLAAAQALAEPLAQGSLSSKHSGGVASSSANQAVSGFKLVDQLVQVPKTFRGGAAHSELDGTVSAINDAPAGGKFITIGGKQHYVHDGYNLKVKPGDKVEAGDVLSEGIPDPSIITAHKGVGEGRRYFIDAFRNAYRDAGIKSHRRNIEVLARALVNHVRLNDEVGDYAPDDVVPYGMLEASYQPREGYADVEPRAAVGQYLEKPYLHYTIGTKIRPSMLKDFQDFGVTSVAAHRDPPPFEPEMIRGMQNLQHDPDWMTRMFGSGLKGSLLQGVARGGHSDETGTSFVPGLAKGVNFGRIGQVRTPEAPTSPLLKTSAGPPAYTPQEAEALAHMLGYLQQHDTELQRLYQTNDAMRAGIADSAVGTVANGFDLAGMAGSIAWPGFIGREGIQTAAKHLNRRMTPYRYSDGTPVNVTSSDLRLMSFPQLAAPVGSAAERSKYHLPQLDDDELNKEINTYNAAMSARGGYNWEPLMALGDAYKQRRPDLYAAAEKLHRRRTNPDAAMLAEPAPTPKPPALQLTPRLEQLKQQIVAGQRPMSSLSELDQISLGHMPPGWSSPADLVAQRQVANAADALAAGAVGVTTPTLSKPMFTPGIDPTPRGSAILAKSPDPNINGGQTPAERVTTVMRAPITRPTPSVAVKPLTPTPPRTPTPVEHPGASLAGIINGGRHEYKAVPAAPPAAATSPKPSILGSGSKPLLKAPQLPATPKLG